MSGRCVTGVLAFALALLAMAAPAAAAPATIQNDVFWKDTSGAPIYSQGGGTLKVGDTWYWYGAKYDAAVTYAADPTPGSAGATFNAVTVYSSKDLANWKFEGEALKAGAAGQHPERGRWFGRMGVAYNKQTRKYVLLSQYSHRTNGGVLFATSDSPTGPFVYANSQAEIENAAGGSGDQTLFQDDDGQAWLIFSSSNANNRRTLYVARLRNSDFLAIEPAVKIYDAPGGGREGNAVFKHKGLYYFASSDLHGWNASRSFYMTSDKITGPYSAEKLIAGSELDFSHVSQNGFFVPVEGSDGTTIIYAGDRWSDFAGNGHGYNVWVPLSFNGTDVKFNSLSQWSLDAAKGTWSVGAGNNYVLNPSFEADRVTQTNLAGWRTTWTNLAGGGPIMNTRGGRTGKWALSFTHAEPTMGNAVQDIALPNGTYTLKVWVRSSGGQAVARLYVVGHGGSEIAHEFTGAADQWTEVVLPGIRVQTGRAQVGVYVEGKAGEWLMLDDFSLVHD